ncbi:MAG TPA: ABC transporter substrate-binding protein, partial [Stellaceae bacterium]|nr:ABC transporter substrate-binding protein [Stellaceae bacterium]
MKMITAAAVAAMMLTPGMASAEEGSFKLGIVTFLSGPAAESFGVPAWKAGQVVVDALNQGGSAPAPYGKPGFGGLKIVPVITDENGGATKQVQEL